MDTYRPLLRTDVYCGRNATAGLSKKATREEKPKFID
jgi:hypothetical protein